MELGGNDPAIILPGTDIDKIADELFRRAFRNCGQVCVAVKRVYVHRDQQRSLVDALSDRALLRGRRRLE
jgi:acyl-CoA reductase-like NAD-dependent aldehyde dehydrogenase